MILTEPQIRANALAVIRRLQGEGAYANLDSGPRFGLMYSWALANTSSVIALDRALAQAFVSTATEMLSEWEASLGIPDGTNRLTAEERQARLGTYRKARSFTTEAIEAALEAIDYDSLSFSSAAATQYANATEGHAMACALDLADGDFDDRAQRSMAVDILARTLPARRYGHHNRRAMSHVVVRDIDPKWNGTEALGESALAAAVELDTFGGDLHPSRVVDYGPLTPLRAEDLNAIQRAMMTGPANGDVHSTTPDSWGGLMRQFSVSATASGTTVIDDADDWRDRIVTVVHRYSLTTDRRPQATDADEFNATATYGEAFFYTGPGGVTYDGTDVTNHFYADATTGALKIENTHGTNTVYAAGFLFATPVLGAV
jgi:hypothetical protein